MSEIDPKHVKWIMIHGSGNATSTNRTILTTHTNSKGHSTWPGNGWPRNKSGYHFVLEKDGQAYQNNPLNQSVYHVRNYNNRSIGICLCGKFDEEDPTVLQLDTLDVLLEFLIHMFPNAQVKGHYEFDEAKTCPGKSMVQWLNKWRAEQGYGECHDD